ncbi:DUF1697 domain-containing protein [Rhodococcus artemisiae]|uniref:DUF1697 domain-containing protein n=1 Tax=Rhodococcus artemisiae TaxID=714159 RepID=A0ABU7L926_9NOCA|nr:DUF1697 domain-containing protein [Rhodococcus artemisiae]MEE2057817.1 DUF1697 domain-containing protein [Rhodococcus artemisiae]
MTRYVALLRGINVGGVRIKMADLAALFTGIGLGNVRTVLASGNVLFDADGTATDLKARIEHSLSDTFGYDAYVFVHPQSYLSAVSEAYPFDEDVDGRHSYAVFVADDSVLGELAGLGNTLDPTVEQIAVGDGVVYWEVEKGATIGSDFSKKIGAARYKPVTTNRNMRTVRKLL